MDIGGNAPPRQSTLLSPAQFIFVDIVVHFNNQKVQKSRQQKLKVILAEAETKKQGKLRKTWDQEKGRRPSYADTSSFSLEIFIQENGLL